MRNDNWGIGQSDRSHPNWTLRIPRTSRRPYQYPGRGQKSDVLCTFVAVVLGALAIFLACFL